MKENNVAGRVRKNMRMDNITLTFLAEQTDDEFKEEYCRVLDNMADDAGDVALSTGLLVRKREILKLREFLMHVSPELARVFKDALWEIWVKFDY
jgi:hypothetical protein